MQIPQRTPRPLPELLALAKSITSISDEWRYTFMPEAQFRKLDPAEAASVYWREMISRAEVVALTSAFKAARWIEALFSSSGNYYSFTSSLRGLIESIADSVYTLRYAPLTLATDHCAIYKQLCGDSRVLTTHKPLEDSLLHFIQATKYPPKADVPDPTVFRAKTIRHYLETFGDERVLALYGILCGVVHPAYESTQIFLFSQQDDAIVCSDSDQLELVLADAIYESFSETITAMGASLFNAILSTLWIAAQFDSKSASSLLPVVESALLPELKAENERHIATSGQLYARALETGSYGTQNSDPPAPGTQQIGQPDVASRCQLP